MENTVLLTLFLPIALGIIMLGLGLSLTPADFRRVVQFPRAVLVGLVCQMIVLPVVAFFIARSFELSSVLAVGLMILAASPGGATANLYSHLAKGDVALNITLTALNSILSLFTLPLIVSFSLQTFLDTGQYIPIQFGKVLEVFGIVLVPVAIGMLLKSRVPGFASRMERPVKIASALLLLLVIIASVLREKENLGTFFQQVGLPALLFNVCSMGVGYVLPRLLQIEHRQAIAIGMEIGIHNGTLAIYLALNVLQNTAMAMPAAIYSLIMFFTAAVFGYLVNRSGRAVRPV
jgi:BASS family bile acid:Na+ symporter